ncbi:hypothetical protein IU459_26950 [Nocardia amamiensis]|uniref:Uncharacterized protein n=1 Tax=Nocardia amamiensis TaxID=404578 RepID=A0ABS0D207_9NOCA|nr:hypothetical protein [Nocardia amamiensis]MBF6301154.1 hypothetical protein [Nocardia amamiensis]
MATATLHIADVGGYAGPARCYRLDPPARIGGIQHQYVTAWISRAAHHQNAEVNVVAACETGSSAYTSLHRRGGSFVLHEDPVTPEQVEGAYWLALLMLGGYEIAQATP